MLRYRTTTHMCLKRWAEHQKKEQNKQNAGHYSARPYVKILAFQYAEIKRRFMFKVSVLTKLHRVRVLYLKTQSVVISPRFIP